MVEKILLNIQKNILTPEKINKAFLDFNGTYSLKKLKFYLNEISF